MCFLFLSDIFRSFFLSLLSVVVILKNVITKQQKQKKQKKNNKNIMDLKKNNHKHNKTINKKTQ